MTVIILSIALASCGSATSSNTDQTTEPPAPTTSTPVATTTTVAAKFNPPSGESRIDCDKTGMSASFGEKLRPEACTATWAMGDTDRDSWNCPKTGCEQTRLYRLVDNKWTSPVICARNQPLTRYALSCYVPNAGPATLSDIPPRDVACIIWATNRMLRYAAETGCTPSQTDINASLSGKCESYTVAAVLPIEKCDSGAAVRLMQARLKAAGLNSSIDGFFGSMMAKNVYSFQQSRKIMATGVIDAATWLALQPDQSMLPGKDRNGDGLVTPDEFTG